MAQVLGSIDFTNPNDPRTKQMLLETKAMLELDALMISAWHRAVSELTMSIKKEKEENLNELIKQHEEMTEKFWQRLQQEAIAQAKTDGITKPESELINNRAIEEKERLTKAITSLQNEMIVHQERIAATQARVTQLSAVIDNIRSDNHQSAVDEYRNIVNNTNITDENKIRNASGRVISAEELEKNFAELRAIPTETIIKQQAPALNHQLKIVEDRMLEELGKKRKDELDETDLNKINAARLAVLEHQAKNSSITEQIQHIVKLCGAEVTPSLMLKVNRENALLGQLYKKMQAENIKLDPKQMSDLLDEVNNLNKDKKGLDDLEKNIKIFQEKIKLLDQKISPPSPENTNNNEEAVPAQRRPR